MKPLNRATRLIVYLVGGFGIVAILLIPNLAPVHMQGYQSPYFANLTFGTASGSAAVTYFPVGTREVFARWTYANVPAGTTLLRQWYRDGKLFVQKEEPWNAQAWGSNGYLSHISIYDYTLGLTPGYYHVVISLMWDYPAAQVSGDFSVASSPSPVTPPNAVSQFSALTMSTSASGPAMTVFPAGTTLVSVRWNYANVPTGALLERDWYFNGVLFRTAQEPWSGNWGASGRLTHVALYDYDHGLASGSYTLVVFLRNYPTVRAQVDFQIGTTTPQQGGRWVFGNLTFSTAATGPKTAIFPHGTTQVFARWEYNTVPSNVTVLRRWYRNGALFIEKQEPWSLGQIGLVQNVSIYDFDYGLLPGDYYVEMSLIGVPNSLVNGYFTIQ